MNTKLIFIAAGVLLALSALFMRNTHVYSGSRREKYETKQLRRRIGIFLLVAASSLISIAIVTHMLISRG